MPILHFIAGRTIPPSKLQSQRHGRPGHQRSRIYDAKKKTCTFDEFFGTLARIARWRPAALNDERELWDRICQKDTAAFDFLYRSYGAGLHAFLRQFLGTSQAAEDVTQETF